MNLKNMLRTTVVIVFALLIAPTAAAQVRTSNCLTPVDFAQWINCRYDELAAAQISQRGNTQQVELPSIAENTTSLVDQSSAPDLMGLALDLAGLNRGKDSDTTAAAATFSAYALYAAGIQHDPLDPAFYMRHGGLRRFSFTIGRDGDTKTDTEATILGAKILLINRRDVTRKGNLDNLDKVSRRLQASTPDFLQVVSDVRDYLYKELAPVLHLPIPATPADKVAFLNTQLNTGNMTATLALLSVKQLDEIDKIVMSKINTKVELIDESLKAFETIRRRPQLSFLLQAKLRKGVGDDDYQAGLTYDYGVFRKMNLTLNGTFNYHNSQSIGGDTRGGKLAAETKFQLTPEKNILGGSGPFLFSMAGSGEWLTKTKPTYIGQAKLTIPIFRGINFPISISVANQTGLLKESTVRGHFGFTFDLAKLISRP